MSYQVIARKWRPQTFAEVVGQQHVTRTLQNAIRSNRVAHAYIFSGVRGVGKTTTARILAKALNCERGPAQEPCNACDRCREIAAGSSLDVIEIDAASSRGIDQIRELREMVRYAPASGRHKVVILDEAHQLTEEASNALLKTLEEPPDRVIFILATTAPDDLPETIRSRTQHFHFRSLSFAEIAGALEQVARSEGLEIEPGAVAVLARGAEGSLRDGLSLLEQSMAYCEGNISDREVRELLGVVSEEALDELMEAVASGSPEKALALVHQMVSRGENLDSFCREAIRHVRNLLIVRVAGADSPMVTASSGERPRLERQASRFSEEDLTRFFQILLSAQADMRRHPDPRLHMEMGLLRIVNAARLTPLEELLSELRGEATEPGAPNSTPPPATAITPSRIPPAAPGINRPRSTSSGEHFPDPSVLSGRAAASPGLPSSAGRTADPPSVEPNLQTAAVPDQASSQNPAAGIEEGFDFETDGIEPAQVQALRAAVLDAQQKFLASLLDHVMRWEISGAELRLYFSPEQRPLAEMLQAREPLEKLRSIAAQVLGRALRVCVKLGSSRAIPSAPVASADKTRSESAGTSDARAEIEHNPAVRSVLGRFGGRVSGVKPAGGS